MEKKTTVFCCLKEYNGLRADVLLGKISPLSRSQIENKIKNSLILLNEKVIEKKSQRIMTGDILEILPDIKQEKKQNDDFLVDILFEHDDFLIINKPAGIVSHLPTDKNYHEPTLVDFASQFWYGPIREEFLKRKGIVHRLDKETSGVMILAKNQYAMDYFLLQFKLRKVKKEYLAFTEKNEKVPLFGRVTYNVMRDPCCPIKMTHAVGQGKEAETLYEVIQKKEHFFLIKCSPLSGRTHQIRVHLSAIGLPIIGDKIYGKSSSLIKRCALHASKIEFVYENTLYSFKASFDPGLENLLEFY
jgi:23S rRNA pseudouridine1911/1915/1917 synthase